MLMCFERLRRRWVSFLSDFGSFHAAPMPITRTARQICKSSAEGTRGPQTVKGEQIYTGSREDPGGRAQSHGEHLCTEQRPPRQLPVGSCLDGFSGCAPAQERRDRLGFRGCLSVFLSLRGDLAFDVSVPRAFTSAECFQQTTRAPEELSRQIRRLKLCMLNSTEGKTNL